MSQYDLKERIVARYGSIHAFCKGHGELNRSTVYMVLSGRYPGRIERQAGRIEAVLADRGPEVRVYQILREVACAGCKKMRGKRCKSCQDRMQAQAHRIAREFDHVGIHAGA